MRDIFINLENNKFRGEVLDVSFVSEDSIVKELCKNEIESERVIFKSRNIKNKIDTSVLFFTLNTFTMDIFKYRMMKTLHNAMNHNAEIYVWDINKPRSKIFRNTIKMLLPDKSIKSLKIKNLNIISDNSFEKIRSIVSKYFTIKEMRISDEVFFIKAVKS